MKWKHFLRYWPFLRGIHRSSVNSPHKGQWHGALMLTLICAWMNVWVNNREAGDLRRHRTRLYVTFMVMTSPFLMWGIRGGIEIISGYRILAFSLVVLQYLSLTVSTSRPGDAFMRQWYGFRQWPVAFSTLLMLLYCHLKPPKKGQLNLDQDIHKDFINCQCILTCHRMSVKSTQNGVVGPGELQPTFYGIYTILTWSIVWTMSASGSSRVKLPT